MQSTVSSPAPRADNAWHLVEGTELVPGRHVVKRLGGGERFEAYVAWDERVVTDATVRILDDIARTHEAMPDR